jgi:hypothetical protein
MNEKELAELERRIILKKQLVIWTQEEIAEMEKRLEAEKRSEK